MITHEEALKLLYNYASDEWNLGTSARKLIDGAYAELEKAINEHEDLKKDVARYFDLLENYEDYTNEFIELGRKLTKAGKNNG